MSIVSFGKYVEGINYKVLEERQVRANSGIMFLFGLAALINGFSGNCLWHLHWLQTLFPVD